VGPLSHSAFWLLFLSGVVFLSGAGAPLRFWGLSGAGAPLRFWGLSGAGAPLRFRLLFRQRLFWGLRPQNLSGAPLRLNSSPQNRQSQNTTPLKNTTPLSQNNTSKNG
jgi:hypothetical protein